MSSTLVTRRRLFLGGGAAAAASAFDALVVEPHWLEVTTHEVPIQRLPRSLDGFTIAQVTDAHLRSIGPVEEAIADALRAHQVQLLAMTGDIVDSSRSLGTLRALCDVLRAPGLTMLGGLGNWEHWGRISDTELVAAYRDSGAKLLVNESVALSAGFRVYATDDSTAGQPRLAQLNGSAGDVGIVLLTHNPAFLESIPKENPFSLALAGHTHGGQVRLGPGIVPLRPEGSSRFIAGWYDVPGGRAYVSRGTGTSILPVRFTCRPELPIFRLRQG